MDVRAAFVEGAFATKVKSKSNEKSIGADTADSSDCFGNSCGEGRAVRAAAPAWATASRRRR